jgi:membrane-bound inhibitor of C-type lysozyme
MAAQQKHCSHLVSSLDANPMLLEARIHLRNAFPKPQTTAIRYKCGSRDLSVNVTRSHTRVYNTLTMLVSGSQPTEDPYR